jgi:hypothetical protein
MIEFSSEVFGAVRGGAKLSFLGISIARARSISANVPRPPLMGIKVETTY